MIETATFIALCMLFLIFFRPGKTPVLNKALVIERTGQYHLTIAPQLNLAQPFLEAVASLFTPSGETGDSSTTQFFEVRDPQVTAQGCDFYLMAVTLRNGILYFQVTSSLPKEKADLLTVIRDFSHTVLARFPDDEVPSAHWDEKIQTVTQEVAKLRKIQISALSFDAKN